MGESVCEGEREGVCEGEICKGVLVKPDNKRTGKNGSMTGIFVSLLWVVSLSLYPQKPWSQRHKNATVFRCFLKVATEMAESIDSERLFQRDGEQEWKALAHALVLTAVTDRLILFSCFISVNRVRVLRQAWSAVKQPAFLWSVLSQFCSQGF